MNHVTTVEHAVEHIAEALGRLLLRGNRAHLYTQLSQSISGVDATTYPVLSGLARTGPITASRLADFIGLDRTVTTRYATRLENAGLLARTPDPHDARATRLTLTHRGQQTVATMRSNLVTILATATASWQPEETAAFAGALQKLTEALTPDNADTPRTVS